MLRMAPRSDTTLTPRHGFTLIELLVVIGIIATLMGLLIPAVTIAKNKAKKAKAVNFIQQIRAGCNSYKNENGFYPEKNMDNGGGPADSKWTKNAGLLLIALQSVDRESFTANSLEDPYGTIVRYRPARQYDFGAAKPNWVEQDNPPGADSYQLWSCGPNKVDDTWDAAKGDANDDIVSWK